MCPTYLRSMFQEVVCLEQRWPVAGEERGGVMEDLQGIVRTLGFPLREMVSRVQGREMTQSDLHVKRNVCLL